jgi:hypothetical protein
VSQEKTPPGLTPEQVAQRRGAYTRLEEAVLLIEASGDLIAAEVPTERASKRAAWADDLFGGRVYGNGELRVERALRYSHVAAMPSRDRSVNGLSMEAVYDCITHETYARNDMAHASMGDTMWMVVAEGRRTICRVCLDDVVRIAELIANELQLPRAREFVTSVVIAQEVRDASGRTADGLVDVLCHAGRWRLALDGEPRVRAWTT